MSSIYTITFSPCIDKSTVVSALIPEKKLRCSDPKLEPGGGGINVARAIHKLGGTAVAVYPSGGYTGKQFDALLSDESVPCHIIPSVAETRENIIVYEESTRHQYRFGMPGTMLTEKEWSACLQVIADAPALDYVVASGSLPPGVPDDIYAQLAKLTKEKSARLVVDTSGEALRQAMNEGVFLIKPNLGELSYLAGMQELDPADVKQVAQQLISNSGTEVMVVSMGSAGAMLVTHNEAYMMTAPPVIRKSTVGAGDSMVAGIIQYLASGKSIREAVQYGVASGTAATLNPGTALCNKKDADRLYTQVNVTSRPDTF